MVSKRQSQDKKSSADLKLVAKAEPGEKIDLLGGLKSHYGDPRQGRGKDGKLLAFIRYEDQIQQALEDGYTVKEIWEFMRDCGVMTASYNTFASYVRTRLGIASGRILRDGSSVSAIGSELVGSEGRETLVLPGSENGVLPQA